jgi:hypothetical protein
MQDHGDVARLRPADEVLRPSVDPSGAALGMTPAERPA